MDCVNQQAQLATQGLDSIILPNPALLAVNPRTRPWHDAAITAVGQIVVEQGYVCMLALAGNPGVAGADLVKDLTKMRITNDLKGFTNNRFTQ
jgi:hypothetical protein